MSMPKVQMTAEQAEKWLLELDADCIEQAQSELARELQVRDRIYPDWVSGGKLSRIEAKDRYDRLKKALEIITVLLDSKGKVS